MTSLLCKCLPLPQQLAQDKLDDEKKSATEQGIALVRRAELSVSPPP